MAHVEVESYPYRRAWAPFARYKHGYSNHHNHLYIYIDMFMIYPIIYIYLYIHKNGYSITTTMLVISMIVRLSSNKWLWLSVAKARTEKPHGAVGHMFGRVSEISSVYIILNGGRHHKLRLIYIYHTQYIYIYT